MRTKYCAKQVEINIQIEIKQSLYCFKFLKHKEMKHLL